LRRDFSVLARQEQLGPRPAFAFELAAMMSAGSVADLMILIRGDASS
jgi:hypothetical protein